MEIRRWTLLHLDVLRGFLPFGNGIRSHDASNGIMDVIAAELSDIGFTQCA